MDYQKILTQIKQEVQPLFGHGKVANYIPALANIPPHKFGMAVRTVKGNEYIIGDATERFSIQSISKVLTLTMAIQFIGEDLWKRVGREPSGTPFNSLVQLEYEQGKPRNPLINAGALVVTDCLLSHTEDALQAILAFIIKLTGDTTIAYDAIVAQSEKRTGQRNSALANFLKSFNNMDNPVEDVLDIYFHQCSLKMSCLELARAFLYLANEGVAPTTSETIVNKRQTKRINALMLTCGLYDAVGDFAYRVGLPGKSGVGGGIVAIIPKVLSIAVWSPELNTSGNSLIGTKALELFTTKTAMSIF